jgi:CRISPR-associated protein Csb2
MLTFGIRYLNGFAAASDIHDRDSAEWPPHPGRVFMAMAAALFESGSAESERAALEWLETQDSPLIYAPEAQSRGLVKQFVPVNDKTGPSKAMLQSAPLARDRQPRTFARAWLEDDTVLLMWPDSEPASIIRNALATLCAKVTRIGHSSSLVQMWLDDSPTARPPNWVPDEDRGVTRLRIATPGTLADLERCFNASAHEIYADLLVAADDDFDKIMQKTARARLKNEFGGTPPPRHRPQLSFSQGYAAPVSAEKVLTHVRGTVFSPHFLPLTLERIDGPYRHLDLLSILAVCQRWHEALCSQCKNLDPQVLSIVSGRAAHGEPLAGPHLAFVPLAFIGHPHADGRLLGVGIALPATISREERRGVFTVLQRVQNVGLKLGPLGNWRIHPVAAQRAPVNLVPKTWTGHPDGATHWATVTPVVFDQHAKSKNKSVYQTEIATIIRLACQRAGLPEPREVIVTPVSAHLGAPPAHTFPRLLRKDGSQRRHSHAILIFEESVRGPILIGAGRYRGYGLCRPISPGDNNV